MGGGGGGGGRGGLLREGKKGQREALGDVTTVSSKDWLVH